MVHGDLLAGVTLADDTFRCKNCDAEVSREETRRRETMGGLDPEKWQTLCCPECGSRLKTIFVADEDAER